MTTDPQFNPATDLEFKYATYPAEAYAGAQIEISWSVENNGDGSNLSDDSVYLSDTGQLDLSNPTTILLKDVSTKYLSPLVKGNSYTVSQLINLPSNLTNGNKYLIFVTGQGNSPGENVLPSQITIGAPTPNLSLVSTSSPIQNHVTFQNTNASGQFISLPPLPQSSPGTGLLAEYYIPDSTGELTDFPDFSQLAPRYTEIDSEINNSSNQNTFTNLENNPPYGRFAAVWTGKINIAQAGDVAFDLSSLGGSRLYIDGQLVVDNGGQHNEQESSGSINLTQGDHDLRLEYFHHYATYGGGYGASALNAIPFTSGSGYGSGYGSNYQDDNQLVLSYTPVGGSKQVIPTSVLTPANLAPAADDLELSNVTVPAVIESGQTVTATWTVTNNSNNSTQGLWNDQVYLSDSPTLDSQATLLKNWTEGATPLGAHQSYTQQFAVPYETPGGHYLIFVTDPNQPESDRSNNAYAVPVNFVTPDLEVTEASAPAVARKGTNIYVSWTDKNKSSQTLYNWYDSVYLSDNTVLDDTDTLLGTVLGNDYYYYYDNSVVPGANRYEGAGINLPQQINDGKWYLLVAANSGSYFGRVTNPNSVYAIPITIGNPDLIVSNTNTPAIAGLNQKVQVSWTDTNQGDAATNPNWYDAVYLSDQPYLDGSAVRLGTTNPTSTQLTINGTYDQSANITIPHNTAIGNKYLLLVTDYSDYQGKTGDSTPISPNNVNAIPITIDAPNLVVSNTNTPAIAGLNQTVQVSWTDTNQGNIATNPNWDDAVYLSDQPTLDGNAVQLATTDSQNTPLAINGTYNQSANITIPHYTTTGNKYLLLVTDYSDYLNGPGGSVPATNPNNVYAIPVTIGAPNLIVSNTTSPTTASLSQTVQVSWTDTNQGNVATNPNWYDAIYLSDQPHLDSSAIELATTDSPNTPLVINGTYNQSINVKIPGDATTGNKYLLLVTDYGDYQGENGSSNSVTAVPITLQAAHLVISGGSAPSVANLGDQIQVSWTVSNQGTGEAPDSWNDYLYFSDSPTFDGTATFVAEVASNQTSLAVGSSDTETQNITVPNTKTGNRYLLIVTNQDNKIGEIDTSNNTLALPIDLKAPDLTVSNIVAPIDAFSNTQIEIDWTDNNQGDSDATGTWSDGIYLRDPSGVKLDLLLGTANFTGTIAPGGSVDHKQLVKLPIDLTGNYQVVVNTDTNNQILESDKTNNSTTDTQPIAVQLSPFPDLQVSSVTAPSQAFSGQQTVVQWTVTNNGTGATSTPYWTDSVWISLTGSIDSTAVKLGQVTNPSYLNVGDSYTNSLSVVLPGDVAGNYYFIVKTDEYNQVHELDANDNTTGTSKVTQVALTPPPDIQPTVVNAPDLAFSGQTATVNWTVTNNGPGPTQVAGWEDAIYLSSDSTLDGSDRLLAERYHYGALNVEDSYSTSQNVTLPVGISGSYYFIVKTDATGVVPEYAYAANDATAEPTPTTIKLTPPPDLEVESISTAPTALASHALTISYQIANVGATTTPNSAWADTFYLSSTPQLDPTTATLLGKTYHLGQLDAGDSYSNSATFTLPDGLNGNYYVFVVDDQDNTVFELNKSNNTGYDPNVLAVASHPADLVISGVSAPSNLLAGSSALVNWTVTNQGTGDTAVSAWTDKVFASSNGVLDSNSVLLGSFVHVGLLSAGSSYSQSQQVSIPINLIGQYQIFVVTNADNKVYQGSGGQSNATQIGTTVTQQNADLQVTQATTATASVSGQDLTVNWTVKNFGVAGTNSNFWYDGVYLSSTPVLDVEHATYLGQVFHSGTLAPGGQYSATGSFSLPIDLSGNYYVIVRTNDADRLKHINWVYEGTQENNNDLATASPTNISLAPVPDLEVTGITAPVQGISGQPLNVTWQVENDGADTGNVGWSDDVYLSRDQNFDPQNDTYIGYEYHTGGLAAGQSYTGTGSFTVPQGISGPYYVFVVADNGNKVYERGAEANKVGHDNYNTIVNLPTQGDLVVDSVNVPASGQPGQTVQVSYTVKNQGPNTAQGSWSDSLYLSADDQWDLGDAFLGNIQHVGDLSSGASYSETLPISLPGVVPGNYHVIVRTDIRNQVPESNENNNTGVSPDQTNIDLPQLQLSASASGTLIQGQSVYYRIDVPEGETLQVSFNASADNAFNELYISYDRVPSQAEFDFGINNVAADQQVVVPLTQAGTYYILARGQNVPTGIENYSIQAKTIDFGISSLGQTTGDRGGKATIQIFGAKFTPGLTAELNDGAGHSVAASNIWFVDSTDVFATFDLTTVPTGTYDLKVSQTVDNIVYQQAANGDIEPTTTTEVDTDVKKGGFSVVDARPDDVLVSVNSTPTVRPGQSFDIIVSYANRGSHDVTAPVIVLKTDPNIRLEDIQDVDSVAQFGSMALLGISNDGPAGVLHPGETGLIRLRGTAPSSTGPIHISAHQMVDDGTPLNYNNFIDYLGGDPSTKPWSDAATALQKQFGDSWTTFDTGLAARATELSTFGHDTHSVLNLWADVALDAWAGSGASSSSASTGTSSTSSMAEMVSPSLSSSQTVNNGPLLANANVSLLSQIQPNEVITYPIPDPFDPDQAKDDSARDTALTYLEQKLSNIVTLDNASGAAHAASALQAFIGKPGKEDAPLPYLTWENELRAVIGNDYIFQQARNYLGHNDKGVDGYVLKDMRTNGVSHYPWDSYYENVKYENGDDVVEEITSSNQFKAAVDKAHKLLEQMIKQKQILLHEGGNDFPDKTAPHLDVGALNYPLKSFANLNPFSANDRDLALLFGSLNGGYALVRYIDVTNLDHKISKCDPVTYSASVDFYWWDGFNFSSDDPAKSPPLKWGWQIQQYGWARPFTETVEINQNANFFDGIIDGPEASDCPDPPPLPPDPGPLGGNPPNPTLGYFDYNPLAPGQTTTYSVASKDPNDISGPQGFGTGHWVTATAPLNYTIRFENDSVVATAPAQTVHITQQLDSALDFRTFRVGDFGFGNTFVHVPDNRAFYQTRLDLTATRGIYVDVTAGVDVGTGEAFWEFTAIDPATGEKPTNPLLGFLPPDLTSPEGEGFVSYTVRPKSTIATGDTIKAQASIIFDTNAPIDTPTISNTIDAGKPTSAVNPLPATVDSTSFPVSWSGSDNTGGSALADFTIYVSDNGGAATPWLSNTTLTAATFTGSAGHTYAFYSVARDNAGNVETSPTAAQASTTIAGAGTLAFSAPTFSVNEDSTPIAAVTITRTGSSSGVVGATVNLTDGTAKAPTDYNNSPINISFATGETSKTVVVPVVDHHIVEGDITVNLSLSNPTSGATIGTQSTATLTIKESHFITDLGTLGGTSSLAAGINASVQVVGTSPLTSGANRAFLFTDTNGNHQVDPGELQNLGTLGGTYSYATAIDDNAHVVGYSSPGSNNAKVRHAFLLSSNGMTDLGTLGGANSQATAIKHNQVVGYAATSNGQTHAFLFTDTDGNGQKDPGENLVDLSTMAQPVSGTYSQATGINSNGDIVGSTNAASPNAEAFYWDPLTGMKVIGTLGGATSFATAINNTNQVVGYATNTGGATHGFVWDKTQGIQDLGTLGGDYSQALGINNKGQVVGTSFTLGSTDSHAFLWQNGKMTDLNSLLSPGAGWDLNSATGINDAGQIVGSGLIGGQQHAFLLSAGLG